MNNELSAASIAAIAPVIASLIAAAISFVNLILTKEQKFLSFTKSRLMHFDRIFHRSSPQQGLLPGIRKSAYLLKGRQ